MLQHHTFVQCNINHSKTLLTFLRFVVHVHELHSVGCNLVTHCRLQNSLICGCLVLIRWYTTMLGKKSSLAKVLSYLKENGVSQLNDYNL